LPGLQIIGVEDNPDFLIVEFGSAIEDVSHGRERGRTTRGDIDLSRQKPVEKRFERLLLGRWERRPSPKRFQISRPEHAGVAGEENGQLRHWIVRKLRVYQRRLEIFALQPLCEHDNLTA